MLTRSLARRVVERSVNIPWAANDTWGLQVLDGEQLADIKYDLSDSKTWLRRWVISKNVLCITTLLQQCVKGARGRPARHEGNTLVVPTLDSAPADPPPCTSWQSVLRWVILTDIDPSYWPHVLHLQTWGCFSLSFPDWNSNQLQHLWPLIGIHQNTSEADTGGWTGCSTHFILPCLTSLTLSSDTSCCSSTCPLELITCILIRLCYLLGG